MNYEEKSREELLQALLTKDTALDASIIPIGITDLRGILTYVNPALVNQWGFDNETDVLGKPATDFWKDPLAVRASIRKSLDTGSCTDELVGKRKDGTFFPTSFHTNSISDLSGKKIGLVASFEDLTWRKQAEKELRESEERHRALFMNSPDAYLIIVDGVFIDCNRATEVILHGNRSLIIGRPPEALSPEFQPDGKKSSDSAMEKIREALETGINKFEWVHRRFDGTDFLVEVSIAAMMLEGKQALFTTWRDITERKKAEVELFEKELFIKSIAENSPNIIYLFSVAEGRNIYTNRSISSLLGYSPEELTDDDPGFFEKLIHPDDLKQFDTFYQDIGDWPENHVFDFEYRVLSKGGVWRWFKGSEKEFQRVNGKVISLIGNVQDITEKKLAEKALELTKESYSEILNSVSEAIYVLDDSMSFIDVNKGAEKMYLFSREELIGQTPLTVAAPGRNNFDEILPMMLGVKATGIPVFFDFWALRKNGEVFPKAVIVSKGTYFGKEVLIATARDITERKKNEQELILAKEKAEESDRLKSAFLANMSHEIRTPMNGILGFAELLKEPRLTGEEQLSYIRIIERSGTRMLNIINDLIDISKIESGQMEVFTSISNINEQLEYISTFFKPEIARKGLLFSCRKPLSNKEAFIRTDREKVYAILTNLVKNAIKYTHAGSITLGYEKKDKFLEFFVADTGIGIADNRKEAIFERFVQADIADKQALEGAGLGLTITKSYVEMLGGKIRVESEAGKGSTFCFTLPYHDLTENTTERPSSVVPNAENIPVNRLKILIAEDEETSDLLLTLALQNLSEEVIHVKTGIDAVDTCRNHPDLDLILMDLKMPGMNGYEATRHIRRFNKTIVIIAQTAYGLSGDREKAIGAGCTDYISKPINQGSLLAMIKKYFS